ncbi:UNVERIFIED_CONTAM: hypothetical protein Slati_1719300 [Sesamum latifolium]|uniref:Retrotransposon Copia-like N-terminal domain-containing protein n=1 Tax=Sesamum latifolium TaxID=2727402 RepID=A0AAW2WWA6_9LAMI
MADATATIAVSDTVSRMGKTEVEQFEKAMLYLHPSDHSSFVLASSPLDGTNYLAWSRAVYVSLGCKLKLGFSDGTFPRPAPGSMNFEQWRRVDLMVTSWLWNSISKEIVEAFMYAEMCASTQLMQFLMGLHDVFDSERSQVLMMDPLPDIEKAFSMFFAVEKQRSVHVNLGDSNSHVAYQLALKENRREGGDKYTQRKKTFVDKKSLVLGDKDKRKKPVVGRGFVANVEATPSNTNTMQHVGTDANVAEMVSELLKLVKQKDMPTDPITHFANFAKFDDEFAGNASNLTEIDLCCWIIDTGATNHICSNLNLFHSYSKISHTQTIHLPDGTRKPVLYTGTVQLSDKIILHPVLYIPEFSVNLLSDQGTREPLAVAPMFKNLYIFQQHIPTNPALSFVSSTDVTCSALVDCNASTWHRRLGHVPIPTIKHIPDLTLSNDSLDDVCDVCALAKQSRISFSLSNSKALAPFDLIHTDLWGHTDKIPYPTAAIS